MAVVNVYKVHYHWEVNGKKVGPEAIDYVQAAGNDFNSIKTVLSNNSRAYGAATLVIDAVQNAAPSVCIA